jgi:hypothetical protein
MPVPIPQQTEASYWFLANVPTKSRFGESLCQNKLNCSSLSVKIRMRWDWMSCFALYSLQVITSNFDSRRLTDWLTRDFLTSLDQCGACEYEWVSHIDQNAHRSSPAINSPMVTRKDEVKFRSLLTFCERHCDIKKGAKRKTNKRGTHRAWSYGTVTALQ